MVSLPLAQGIGFTGENPRSSRLRQEECLCWCDKHLLRLDEHDIFYNEKKLCELDFHTMDLAVGQSVGILLTRGRDLHWFVDDQWRGVVHVNNYPLGEPMWGVVDMYGVCKQVRAEICTGESYTAVARFHTRGCLDAKVEIFSARIHTY